MAPIMSYTFGQTQRQLKLKLAFPLVIFPGGSDSKESACNAGDPGSIPELGRSPGEGYGNPHQYLA